MIAYSQVESVGAPTQDDLVVANLSLVKRIAYHLSARMPSSVDIDDLIQAGMLGLIEAASSFDASRGASFETYAGIRIRGAMIDDIRRHDWTPRSVHHKYRQVAEAIHAIEAREGRAAEPAEVAGHLGIELDEYHRILSDSASCRLCSLEESLGEIATGRDPAAADGEAPDELFSKNQFAEQLAAAIEALPEREKLVLSLYYEQDLNLKEIGAVLDVSESRVSQIHGQAVLRLRRITEHW